MPANELELANVYPAQALPAAGVNPLFPKKETLMKRRNVFPRIHKALRKMLFETGIALQQTNFNQVDEVQDALEKVRMVSHAFHNHAHKEDHFIFPLIAGNDPALVERFEAEHVEDEQLSERLTLLADAIEGETDIEARVALGNDLLTAFHAFTAFNLNHMNREEQEFNSVLWQHVSDEEIAAAEARLVASIDPAEMAALAPWMISACSTADLREWLEEVQAVAPVFVYQGLCGQVAANLPAARWQKLSAALDESRWHPAAEAVLT
jgi:hypothetical protein